MAIQCRVPADDDPPDVRQAVALKPNGFDWPQANPFGSDLYRAYYAVVRVRVNMDRRSRGYAGGNDTSAGRGYSECQHHGTGQRQ